ncbi:MAG: hypothetical protein J6Q55_02835, partial [Clostridia bacterium]|nr:hypothetical protein [Clostridia bacterium]
TAGKVVVEKVDNDTEKLTYTVTSVSDGYVYYTQANEKNNTLDGLTVRYARFDGTTVVTGVVLNATPSGTWFGWGAKAIYVETETHGSTTAKTHTVYATYVENGETKKDFLFDSRDEITLVKIENGVLFYISGGFTYTVELGTTNAATVYAKDTANFTTTGWGAPDVVGKYTFAIGLDVVTVISYDAQTKENSAVTNLTLFAEEEAE